VLANIAAALPFAFFCRKETMELSKEFGNVDILPIGEDVRHLDDPTTPDYDLQRLILEKSEYQSRINDMLAVKYAMLFAEQEQK
jgi:hypothetical protein